MGRAVCLVHGSGHGSWLWERVVPELVRLGYDVTTVDLPCDDPQSGLIDYRDTVLRAVTRFGPELELVGHSLGGITLPLVAEEREVRRMVMLCAVVPVPGRSQRETLQAEPDRIHPDAWEFVTGRLHKTGEYAELVNRLLLEPDCGPEEKAIVESNRRDQSYHILDQPCPLEAWPAVETRFIIGRQDHMVMPDWSRRISRKRFGEIPIEINGGHMLPLTRPKEVAAAISAP